VQAGFRDTVERLVNLHDHSWGIKMGDFLWRVTIDRPLGVLRAIAYRLVKYHAIRLNMITA
jgi:hypothetical protein